MGFETYSVMDECFSQQAEKEVMSIFVLMLTDFSSLTDEVYRIIKRY